jgi:sarcosine oxidase subunit beta
MAERVTYLSELPRTADLVIIGGGVVGAATAFHAARAGLRPLLLERRPRLCTLTTPASTGAFRLQFDNQEELELVRESVELFLHFGEVTGQCTYDLDIRQQGYLWLTTTDEGVERQRRIVAAQHGWGQRDIELLDGDEVRGRFPYVSQNVLQARFRAGDGFLDPKALTLGLAAASSVPVVTNCAVTGFCIEGGRLTGVQTGQGEVQTDMAVIAAGPFSGLIAAQAGVDLPITTVLRQKVIIPLAPEVPQDAPMTIDDDTGAHWRPALRGAYLLFTDPATPPSPPTENVTPEQRFAFRLLDPASPVSVARIVPFWRQVWERSSVHWILQGGQYTMTPDHRPLIGPTPVEGLYVNSGYSGHGIMGSPAGSRLLVDVLTGKLVDAENPFRLDRTFARRELDRL